MRSVAIMVGLALTASGAQAATAKAIDPEREYSATYRRCLETGDAARGVTPAMGACIHAELDRQDARLNGAYKAAMARLSPQGKVSLRNTQRAWIRNRDQSCRENLTGGTIDMLEVPGCHLSMTAVRAVELEQMARRRK